MAIDYFPIDIPAAKVPLTIISGPPGAGKTTSIKGKRTDGTLVIDFAEIKARVSGLPLYVAGDDYLEAAIAERNRMLKSINDYESAFFITNAPQYPIRKHWNDMLQPDTYNVLLTEADVCLDRIAKDPTRAVKSMEFWARLVNHWWDNYTT